MGQQDVTEMSENLPEDIPVFPLGGVLLLPGGQLPLNIFEKRYLDMVDYALSTHKLIGMVQPKINNENDNAELEKIGCAGRITDYSETSDGRYLITLTGVSRFFVSEEKNAQHLFRVVAAKWDNFKDDLSEKSCLGLKRDYLYELLEKYFSMEQLECDWDAVKGASDNKLITCLSMICPLPAREKQALLEAQCCKTRGDLFIAMLEMVLKEKALLTGVKH